MTSIRVHKSVQWPEDKLEKIIFIMFLGGGSPIQAPLP